MFGLRIQNNMYLTLQFKKLNSNMCLVGFPENIESWSIKLNKYQLQLVVSPSLFLSLPSFRVFSNYFQTPSFSKLGTFHMFGLHEATGSHWLTPHCSADTPCFPAEPSGPLLMLVLCLACFPVPYSLRLNTPCCCLPHRLVPSSACHLIGYFIPLKSLQRQLWNPQSLHLYSENKNISTCLTEICEDF